MKTLKVTSVILLLAISAQAQTVADAARKERERQAQIRTTLIKTIEGGLGTSENKPAAEKPAAPPEQKVEPKTEPKTPATPEPVANPAPPAPVVDPAIAYNAQLEKLRRRIQELIDQETALELQRNQLTNQFLAPVSDQATKDQAQTRIGEVQNQLTAVRMELDQTKKTLDALVQQGPPKK